MSTEENKAIVQRLFEEVFNQKQVDRADELVAPDYLDHGAVPGQAPGLEGAKQQRWAMYFAAIPDLHATIDDLVAEGDEVVVCYTAEGTRAVGIAGRPSHREALPDQ
jgi:predicted ester cyclase